MAAKEFTTQDVLAMVAKAQKQMARIEKAAYAAGVTNRFKVDQNLVEINKGLSAIAKIVH